MLNVDALSKTLTAMPLPQLQQYAAMHKNDPYVVSLALSIANQKKQMQVAQDGAAGQQQQPKVADQAIAGMAPQAPAQHMLPEEQGIGALAAPNIQHMAEGGIIGNEGEEQQAGAFDFRSENEPVVRMAGGGMVSFAGGGDVPRFAGTTDGSFVGGLPGGIGILPQGSFSPQVGAADNQTWAQRKMDELAAKVQAGTATPQERAWISMFGGDATGRVNMRQQQSIYQNAPDQMGAETQRLAAAAQMPTQQMQMPPTGGLSTLAAAQQPPAPVMPAAPAAPAATAASSYIDRFKKEMGQQETGPNKEEFMKERSAISEDTYADIAKKLAENTAKMKSDKDESAYMAMIKGGLAMAGGSSPYALTNIAKGLESGAADYSEALKEFRKATTEQNKMEIELARAKAAEKRGDMDAYQKAMEKVGDRNAQRDDRQAAGVAALLGGEMTAKSAANVAGIHAAATGASANAQRNLMEALGSAPENSPLRKGFELSKQEGRVPAMYDAYVKAATDPMKGEDFVRKYPTFQTYLAGMGGGGAGQFITGPQAANAPVLQRKN